MNEKVGMGRTEMVSCREGTNLALGLDVLQTVLGKPWNTIPVNIMQHVLGLLLNWEPQKTKKIINPPLRSSSHLLPPGNFSLPCFTDSFKSLLLATCQCDFWNSPVLAQRLPMLECFQH